ncbi:RNA 2',3'-cyclic phosphodiesterase [Saccharospirillum salsuginis]|uniref:RNA 2',3'-cyclic phosphodiesterase n=1 Tax=Saccharospirillum salsuginis TaxID=418750 RepID=A0A918NBL9_9GAMM|nr:RNA 2',3'-cyclic phosphodiesterase [Saccharospirillum salsuginis]GGX58519.1 RNA 2',3'-cyclic phosphodiesterase [Saccharospirillum salsuginis]
MKRLFFALPCPNSTRRAVLDWREHNLTRLKRHWVPEPNLHITLAFIGGVEDERLDALFRLGDQLEARGFQLTLDKVGQFGRGKYVWLGPSRVPSELGELVKTMNQALSEMGFPVDKRAYVPHLTVAKKAPPVTLPWAPEGIEMPVHSFALYESVPVDKGVRYDVQKQWPLRKT